jgi:hypothetical protein
LADLLTVKLYKGTQREEITLETLAAEAVAAVVLLLLLLLVVGNTVDVTGNKERVIRNEEDEKR